MRRGMKKMKAMVLTEQRKPLELREVSVPKPSDDQVLIRVYACGVCRTDLHILDGEVTNPKMPLIMGHQIVGRVEKSPSLNPSAKGKEKNFLVGDRVGVPWLGWTCGKCKFCLRGQENLCEKAKFTGYTVDGGFAEYAVADYRYCFPIDDRYSFTEAAPLLCAGLIGYRSYKLAVEDKGASTLALQKSTHNKGASTLALQKSTHNKGASTLALQRGTLALRDEGGQNIGIYGFGAAAHIITQVAVHQGKNVYAFTRKGDLKGQEFARSLGAVWAGDSSQTPPVKLDSAIIFAPAGELVPKALEMVDKGGSVVLGGIHMSDIPSFPYNILWGERVIRSVANLTRQDGEELMKIAPEVPVKTTIEVFKLEEANEALSRIRSGQVHGAAVLSIIN